MENFIVKGKYSGRIFEVYRMGERYYELKDYDCTSYKEDDLEFITDKPYWENLKHQYIGQFTAAMLSNPKIIEELIEHHVIDNKHQIIADIAIEQTDVIINKLREER
jgi:hypothetical protein